MASTSSKSKVSARGRISPVRRGSSAAKAKKAPVVTVALLRSRVEAIRGELRKVERSLAQLEHRSVGPSKGNSNGKSRRSLGDRLKRLGLLGCIKGTPPDLSTNPKYMEGFGES